MNNFCNMVGGGIALFLFFAGVSLLYWVMDKCDKNEKGVKP